MRIAGCLAVAVLVFALVAYLVERKLNRPQEFLENKGAIQYEDWPEENGMPEPKDSPLWPSFAAICDLEGVSIQFKVFWRPMWTFFQAGAAAQERKQKSEVPPKCSDDSP